MRAASSTALNNSIEAICTSFPTVREFTILPESEYFTLVGYKLREGDSRAKPIDLGCFTDKKEAENCCNLLNNREIAEVRNLLRKDSSSYQGHVIFW